MGEQDVFRFTIYCAAGGVALGAVLGFLNGWARARFVGQLQRPPWLETSTESPESEALGF